MNSHDHTTGAPRSQRYRPAFSPAFLHPRFWGVWLVLGLMALSVYLPRRVRRACGGACGVLFYRWNAKRRRIATINLKLCFPGKTPPERRRMLLDHFRCYGMAMLDFGLLWWAGEKRLGRLMRYEGLAALEQLLKDGRRVILLAPHSVSVDLPGLLLSRLAPTITMMKPLRNPLLNYFLCRGRSRYGGTLVARDQGLAHLVRAMRRHALCYYLPDEDFGPEASVFAPFFATRAATITALGRIARLGDALVVPVYSQLTADGGYRVHVGEPLRDFPAADAPADATRMNRALESMIALAPEQYMWTLRRFRTRPPGEANPYR